MSNRLKIILIVGIVAIALTYFGTYMQDHSAADADKAYQQQLDELRKKQEEKLKRSKAETDPSSISQTASSTVETTAALPNSASTTMATKSVTESPFAANSDYKNSSTPSAQVTQHIKDTLASLQHMMPGANPKLPVANYDSNAQRLQYLQTMPIAVIESTGKQDAQMMARQNAGRLDPFAELPASQPFPKSKVRSLSLEKVAGKKSATDFGTGPDGLPPPPSASASASLADLAPPPPPPGIELDELPPPPDKPMLSKSLKLNAIVGDHIILAFKDRHFQKKNHFKQYITLAQGQEFDTMTLVAIGKDQATIEENGRQITMELDPIR